MVESGYHINMKVNILVTTSPTVRFLLKATTSDRFNAKRLLT